MAKEAQTPSMDAKSEVNDQVN